jgi:hypothetical protein
VVFGLSAISVYIDVVIARVLAATALFFVLCLLFMGLVVWIKAFTDLAIPGWTTNALGFLVIALLQTFAMSIAAILFALNGRSMRETIPAKDAFLYILRRHNLFSRHG